MAKEATNRPCEVKDRRGNGAQPGQEVAARDPEAAAADLSDGPVDVGLGLDADTRDPSVCGQLSVDERLRYAAG